MKIKQAYIGQPVALDRSPGDFLGTVAAIKKHGIVEVKLKDNTHTDHYGVRVLTAYRGG